MKKIEEIEINKTALASLCRTVRLEHGLTIEDFAERFGFTRQTVHNFESGKHITLDVFLKYYVIANE